MHTLIIIMFVHTVIMVIEPHMKQGRQHKLISTIFLATSVTKMLDHNKEMLLVEEVDQKEFLTGLFHAMYDELPLPKPKKKK